MSTPNQRSPLQGEDQIQAEGLRFLSPGQRPGFRSATNLATAAVSGLYFAHPKARYFSVGRIGEDQIVSYARRKGQSVDQVERWLGSNLAYEPARC